MGEWVGGVGGRDGRRGKQDVQKLFMSAERTASPTSPRSGAQKEQISLILKLQMSLL